jgi:hypothetical protein
MSESSGRTLCDKFFRTNCKEVSRCFALPSYSTTCSVHTNEPLSSAPAQKAFHHADSASLSFDRRRPSTCLPPSLWVKQWAYLTLLDCHDPTLEGCYFLTY